jgi:hypothetical protein
MERGSVGLPAKHGIVQKLVVPLGCEAHGQRGSLQPHHAGKVRLRHAAAAQHQSLGAPVR